MELLVDVTRQKKLSVMLTVFLLPTDERSRPLCTSSTVLLVVNCCASWYVYAFKPRIMR